MDFELWSKVLEYASNVKYCMSKNGYIPDKILRKKVAQSFIIDKFLYQWMDRNQDDPIDIIDSMILKYSMWESNARAYNNTDLIEIYDIYTKTVSGVKNFILKEMKI